MDAKSEVKQITIFAKLGSAMTILALLFFFCCLIEAEARFFLIETKEKTTTNEIFLRMTNSRTFLISTGKCHKQWKKANHGLTRWNVRSKICGNEECMQVAEKLHQICKQVELQNVIDLTDISMSKAGDLVTSAMGGYI